MPSFITTLSALAILSFASATPIRRAKQAFTVHEDVAKRFTSGPVLMYRTYQKFGAAIPPDIEVAAADSSVTATPEQYDSNSLEIFVHS
jgi:hypothetical protein